MPTFDGSPGGRGSGRVTFVGSLPLFSAVSRLFVVVAGCAGAAVLGYTAHIVANAMTASLPAEADAARVALQEEQWLSRS